MSTVGSARSVPSQMGQSQEFSFQETPLSFYHPSHTPALPTPHPPSQSPMSLALSPPLHCCYPVPPGPSLEIFRYYLFPLENPGTDCTARYLVAILQNFNLCPHLTPEPTYGAFLRCYWSPSSNPLSQMPPHKLRPQPSCRATSHSPFYWSSHSTC